MSYKVVGEGTYGCVVKPPLKCSDIPDSKIDYTDKISKLMNKTDANSEFKELNKISKFTGIEKYAISLPIKCEPVKDKNFSSFFSDCEGEKVNNAYRRNRLGQLLLQDGGVNLQTYIEDIYPFQTIDDKKIFFTSIINLFDGLLFFNKKKLVHFDIKLINLVYNVKTGQSKFIDFGMLKSHNKIKNDYTQGNAWYGRKWFNWPPENECGNRPQFNSLDNCKDVREKFSYSEFLDRLVNTFDSYSLCLCLLDVIYYPLLIQDSLGRTTKYEKFAKEVNTLFNNYCNSNIIYRDIDLNLLKNKYLSLLKEYNIYIKTTPTPSKETIKKVEKLNKESIDNVLLKINCPPEKPDFNPNTKRCLKSCKKGFERNSEYKCVKTKKVLLSNTEQPIKDLIVASRSNAVNKKNMKKIIECLKTNKDYNKITNRCVNQCKKGFIRDKQFKCVRRLNTKAKSLNISKTKKNNKSKFRSI